MNFKLVSALAAFGLASAAPAMSATLDFEGFSYDFVDTYYAGGQSFNGVTGGPDYGISFGPYALALTNEDIGGGLFPAGGVLGNGILAPTFDETSGNHDATLNSAAGFSGVSFLYSSLADTSVTVWSGLDGSGTALYTFNLLTNANSDESALLANWDSATADLMGQIGHSITFGDVMGTAGFDNVDVSEVPLPAAAWLLVSGLGGLGGLVRRRRAAAA